MQCSRRESCSRVFTLVFTFKAPGCSCGVARRCFLCPLVHLEVLAPVQSSIPSLSVFGGPELSHLGTGVLFMLGLT